jgi:hypothetical protein
MSRVLILLGILVAGGGSWYWKHLQFLDKRGLLYSMSPEYGGHVLLAGYIILTAVVLWVAWKELFPGKRPTLDPNPVAHVDEDRKAS